jgi:hypothetical protein
MLLNKHVIEAKYLLFCGTDHTLYLKKNILIISRLRIREIGLITMLSTNNAVLATEKLCKKTANGR